MSEGRRYKILGMVGRGGFGTVYRADLLGESGFTRQVALKVLNADMENVRTVASRLRDEARLLGLLRHRAIIDVDGLVRLGGRWTVVMEYIDGADISKIIAVEPIPQAPALEIIGEVAAALHAAYTQPGPEGQPLKLLHRDIKPPNVVVTPNGEVKVLDFGVARADFAGREAKTRKMLFGSLGYMAPERFARQNGPEADVFAIGVMFYEMLTGDTFGRSSANEGRFRKRRDEVLAGLVDTDVHPEVAGFLARMIAFEKEDRPTARDVERACRDLRVEVREGPWLRDWAEHAIPPLLLTEADLGAHDFDSDIVTETRSDSGNLEGGWPDAEQPPPRPDRSMPTFPPEDDEPEPPPPPPPANPTMDSVLAPVVVASTPRNSNKMILQILAVLGIPIILTLVSFFVAFVGITLMCLVSL